MISPFELFRFALAMVVSKIAPSKLRTRLCRLIYNYNSARNKGFDWIIDYQPLSGIRSLKLLVNTKEFISWNILFLNHYEQNTNLILQKKIKEGMYVVEAGSQIGSETVLLGALVGSTGKVFAFEPNPLTLKRLRLNIEINDFSDRIVSADIALGDTNQAISFFIDDEKEPNQGRASKYNYDARTIKITARQQKLDDWMREHNIPRIDFIKMDVQGAEIDVLHGAKKSIKQFKPLIFTEVSASMQNGSGHGIESMYRMLTSLGYTVHLIAPKGELQTISKDSMVGGNWLATPLP